MRAQTARRLPIVPLQPRFDEALRAHGLGSLRRGPVRALQVNMGKRCNMSCRHCHVDAGPRRTETLTADVADRVLELLRATPAIEVLDLTGGAPELNPSFRRLVSEARGMNKLVIDRCNLTVLFEPGQEDLPELLAAHEVHVVASLPCYQADNVDAQRGRGAFDDSIRALRRLNALGYGRAGSDLRLSLVYNPLGASLPPPQDNLFAQYSEELGRRFGVEFHELLTITNMPIGRFADWLARRGQQERYEALLAGHFNPSTVPELMCRSLVSVRWDGALFDCDFNQMLDVPLGAGVRTIWDGDALEALSGARIATADHCSGCTAGAGSSCSGALR